MITSLTNPRIKRLRRLLRDGAGSLEKCLLIEGIKLAEEAMRSRIKIEEVFVSDEKKYDPSIQRFIAAILKSGGQLIEVSNRLFLEISDTETPQGLIALGKLPTFGLNDCLEGSPLLLIGVGIQDPGNVGTLLRSAEAFGVAAVLLTRNSASAWSPKVVRASAGSIFRMPCIDQLDGSTLVSLLQDRGFTLIATTPRGGQDFRQVSYVGKRALLIGNEAHGLDGTILRTVHSLARIPMSLSVDSLNAATSAAIILCEAARQRNEDIVSAY